MLHVLHLARITGLLDSSTYIHADQVLLHDMSTLDESSFQLSAFAVHVDASLCR